MLNGFAPSGHGGKPDAGSLEGARRRHGLAAASAAKMEIPARPAPQWRNRAAFFPDRIAYSLSRACAQPHGSRLLQAGPWRSNRAFII